MGRPSAAAVVEFGAFGDGVVVAVGEPVLGEDDLRRGTGAASWLAEDLAGEGDVGVEFGEEVAEFGQG
jgi:hypothetical protein